MAQLIVTTSAQEQPSATADRDRPPLHIVSAGRAISARAYAADGWFTFELPAGPGPVQLTTPSGRAATSADPRKLGLPILAIELDGAAIALDAPELGGGFHPSEGDGTTISWRWTDGAASLILPKRMVTVTLRVRVALWYNSIIR
jgi:hypothetical protein